MFRINDKDTRMMLLMLTLTIFQSFSIVFIGKFEQVLVCWFSLSFADYIASRQRNCRTDNGKSRTTYIVMEWPVLQNIRYLHWSFSWGYERLYGIDTEALPSQVNLKIQFSINVMSKLLALVWIALPSYQCSRWCSQGF